MEFICQFELVLFPFDTQVIQLKMVSNDTKLYFTLYFYLLGVQHQFQAY